MFAIVFAITIIACAKNNVLSNSNNFFDKPHKDIRLGYAFFVERMVGTWNSSGFIPRIQKNFYRDLPILASLGAPAVKITMGPAFKGLIFTDGKGAKFDKKLIELTKTNMITIIRGFKDHGIPVVIDFVLNDYYLRGPNGWIPNNKPNWHEYSYLPMGYPNGAEKMAEDFVKWENEFIHAIKNAGLDSAILYYNLFTEAHYSFKPYAKDITSIIVKKVLSDADVSDSKRAADAYPYTDAKHLLADVKAVGKPIAITEVHAYPDLYKYNIKEEFKEVQNLFPNSIVVFGEISSSFCASKGNEDAEANTMMKSLDEGWSAKSPIAFNWGLWDFDKSTNLFKSHDSMRFGIGFSPNKPRNLYGKIIDRYSALPNGDFESGTAGWSSKGNKEDGHSGISSLKYCSTNQSPAATGNHFIRLIASEPGVHELISPSFKTDGSKLALSAHLRSTSPENFVFIDFKNKTGWNFQKGIRAKVKKLCLPDTNTFWHIQEILGGEIFALPEDSTDARIRFVSFFPDCTTSNKIGTTDLDAVSVNTF